MTCRSTYERHFHARIQPAIRMNFSKIRRRLTLASLCFAVAAPVFPARASDLPSASTRLTPAAEEHPNPQRRGFGQPQRGVYKARITPHWFDDNTRFWYTNGLAGGNWEFVLVDATQGK